MLRSLILVSLAACGRGSDPQVSAWGLQISPIVPDGVDPFLPDSDLTLRVIDADGVESVPLGASDDLTWTVDDRPALAGSRIGLLLTDPNVQIDPLDYADVRGYGQTGPVDLSSGTRSLPLVVAAFGELGGLGALPDTRRSIAPALAVLPDGDALLFGGTDSVIGAGVTSPAWRHVLRLSHTDDDVAFEEVGQIPELTSSDEERVGAAATVIDTATGPQVLVTGGRYKFTPANKSSLQAFRWDPSAGEAVWDARLPRGRSQHVAVEMASGDVLLAGGWDETGRATEFTFDWYRAADEDFEAGATLTGVGPVGFAWADLGEGGALFCGGAAAAPGDASLLVPSPTCQRVGQDGGVRGVADIGTSAMHLTPAPRLWAAAATLADGRVLLCGGADATIPSGETRPATADAFLYDPATLEWEPISPMRHARAMHRLVALGDGTVLVIGGADAAFGAAPGAAGEPVAEIERFDPDLDAFTAVGAAPIELGSLPAVAWAPGQGLIAVAGVVGQGGGAEYGIVGLGP